MSDELIRLSATEAAARLKAGDITPLDLIDAAEARIAAVDGDVNALPTLCLDRARDHARALMAGKRREAESEAGWLGGIPVAIKDLAEVAGVRTTYGSPIFADYVPKESHPLVERIERLNDELAATLTLENGRVQLRDARNGRRIFTYPGHSGPVPAGSFNLYAFNGLLEGFSVYCTVSANEG